MLTTQAYNTWCFTLKKHQQYHPFFSLILTFLFLSIIIRLFEFILLIQLLIWTSSLSLNRILSECLFYGQGIILLIIWLTDRIHEVYFWTSSSLEERNTPRPFFKLLFLLPWLADGLFALFIFPFLISSFLTFSQLYYSFLLILKLNTKQLFLLWSYYWTFVDPIMVWIQFRRYLRNLSMQIRRQSVLIFPTRFPLLSRAGQANVWARTNC